MPKLLQIANPKPEDVRQTAQRLKQFFIENAEPLLKEYINAALGVGKLSSNSADARQEVWDLLKKLMLQSSDKLEIDIKSAEDVLEAVSSGKCTFDEGEKLLNLYKKVREINEVGSGGFIGDHSINIQILSNAEPIQKTITVEPAAKNIIEGIKIKGSEENG